MDKLVVIVFDVDQAKAFEALRGLKQLDSDGEISLYRADIVVKTPEGLSRVTPREEDQRGIAWIGGGAAVGALIGLLGGPVGAAIGAGVGAVAGSIGDVESSGVTDEFVQDVLDALTPGKVAVIADLEEGWTTPLDVRMEELGGVVLRRARSVVKITQHDHDVAAHQAEVDQLKAERQQARADGIAKIDAKIDQARAKLEAAIERRRTNMRANEDERDARIKALEARARQAKGEIRRRQEARIVELRRDYKEAAARAES